MTLTVRDPDNVGRMASAISFRDHANVSRQAQIMKVRDAGNVSRLIYPPLNATASPSPCTITKGAPSTSYPGFIVDTPLCTVTPTGGIPPYTYAWGYVSGNVPAGFNPTSAANQWGNSFSAAGSVSGVNSCTVTDSTGAKFVLNVNISITAVQYS